MTRILTLCPVVALVLVAGSAPVAAQLARHGHAGVNTPVTAAVGSGDLSGTVRDQGGLPLAGAAISASGATSASTISARDGTFVFKGLPPGPYLVRVHLQGYATTRARTVQVNAGARTSSTIELSRRGDATETPELLEAGIGAAATSGEAQEEDADTHDQGEVAWRLRHLKRSVLRDADIKSFTDGRDDIFEDGSSAGLNPASDRLQRFPLGLFSAMPLNGQVNLLTRTSFDRPGQLFALDGAPRGVTYLELSAPTGAGEWAMRAAMTQGDLSSWIVSGSYLSRAQSAHQYESGLSYGTQQYVGGNVDALAAVSDGSRNVGAVFAFDHWRLGPQVSVSYGAKYARYDYLNDRGLLSPSASITVTPSLASSVRVHGRVSRREVAPGGEEFLPPSTGLWLPPERTFSPVSQRHGLSSERIDHVEASIERQWLGDFMIGIRGFRQEVEDQIATLFGVALPGTAAASIGHYYVGSSGDFVAHGWGLGISRQMVDGLRASVDYTQTDADWQRVSPDRSQLLAVAGSTVRTGSERTHDLTTSVESRIQATATQFLAVYKINTGFAAANPSPIGRAGARFGVQVIQALPFLNFSTAEWEMLVSIRNLFSEELLSGSIYDELLVVKPPTRVVGGLTVRF